MITKRESGLTKPFNPEKTFLVSWCNGEMVDQCKVLADTTGLTDSDIFGLPYEDFSR